MQTTDALDDLPRAARDFERRFAVGRAPHRIGEPVPVTLGIVALDLALGAPLP